MRYRRIGRDSQRGRSWVTAYNQSPWITLDDCYGTYSIAKRQAYNFCVSEMCAEGGFGKRILSHNSTQFTFAYLCDLPIVGYVLRVITKSNNYEIPLYK